MGTKQATCNTQSREQNAIDEENKRKTGKSFQQIHHMRVKGHLNSPYFHYACDCVCCDPSK